ncbi:MAG: S9 family peptidase [Wenzhouxiangella sp.]
MKFQSLLHPFLFLIVGLLAVPSAAKVPLDHDVYTSWNWIETQALSRDGQWALWRMAPEQADGVLVVRSTALEPEFRIERGNEALFSHDSRHVVFLVEPGFAEARLANVNGLPDEELPQSSLGILSLDDGREVRYQQVKSFALPEASGDWLAFLHGVEPEEPEVEEVEEEELIEDEEKDEVEESESDAEQKPGTTLVVRSLESALRHDIDHVSDYAWSPDGTWLAVIRVAPDGQGDGVWVVDPQSGEQKAIVSGTGKYKALVFDSNSQRLAFLGRRDNEERDDHAYSLFYWTEGANQARVLADETSDILAAGWHVSEHHEPLFSDTGSRLYFGIAPPPIEIPDHEELLDDEVVRVDIWHWQDEQLQPMQLVELEEERKRSYLAVAHLEGDDRARLVQLGRVEIPEIEIANGGDAPFALGLADRSYRAEMSWEFPGFADGWLIEIDSGQARQILTRVQDKPVISPAGGYISWWDRHEASWSAVRLSDNMFIDLGSAIDHPLDDHANDRPFVSNPYAGGLWLDDDSGFVIHDRHDVWLVDPENADQPVSLSQGIGRERGWNIRLVDLDPDEDGIDPDRSLLATVFDEQTREHGFYQLHRSGNAPVELIVSGHHFGDPIKADNADRLLFTRENFDDFPNLWVSASDFSDMQQLSDANPQQTDYRWGQVELVEWVSTTGVDHQGLLYKPEDFDPARAYPMIVYFYERDSHRLFRHRAPEAHRSVIIPTFYTSNDYVVFMPDVWYREGYPGDSAMEAIMPKVHSLAEEPWINADRVGIQGHSWAGYQIAYMITQTDFFRAAAGGAPVANMTSAYGGIRWGTGMSRMFQYERTQSRLGKTLWEDLDLYLHNSPLFMADRITTPLLMMHNDEDGAVPWEQGIEMFVALRRLGRPAWLINYNEEPHWPTTFANRRDWQIRMQQYFDHYLKDEPAPRWLRSGIPAMEKGATLGLETD